MLELQIFLNRLNQRWYELRCRVWDKYNVFHVTTLAPTYSDPVEQLLHVNFYILTMFVEKEHPFGLEFSKQTMIESISWLLEHNGENEDYARPQLDHQHAKSKEAIELYCWWKYDRPIREEQRNDNYDYDFDQDCENEDQKMLHRLVDIRRSLWT